MGWRDAGVDSTPRPIKIQTCDQCGKDIGHPGGYGSNPNYEIRYDSTLPDCDIVWHTCSKPCLAALASRLAANEDVAGNDY